MKNWGLASQKDVKDDKDDKDDKDVKDTNTPLVHGREYPCEKNIGFFAQNEQPNRGFLASPTARVLILGTNRMLFFT